MEINDIYSVIFKRKSIRKYDLSPLDDDDLKKIEDHIDHLTPLYSDIKIDIKIVSANDVKTKFIMKKAPHYLAMFSEVKEDYLTNVGFMLQQMDLILSSMGIGTCWQEIPNLTTKALKLSKLKFIILLAFGKPLEPLYRESISEFKRKPLQKISNFDGDEALLEPSRLAPSATNNQPWFFTGNDNIIHIYSIKPNILKSILLKRTIPIDIGIAMYHLKVAAEHFNKNFEIVFDKTSEKNGYIYYASMNLE